MNWTNIPRHSPTNTPSPYRWVHYLAYGILLLSFLVALVNVWFNGETTTYAFKIDEIQKEKIALDNEIQMLKVQLEELRSPMRISAIAEELGMELSDGNYTEIQAER